MANRERLTKYVVSDAVLMGSCVSLSIEMVVSLVSSGGWSSRPSLEERVSCISSGEAEEVILV